MSIVFGRARAYDALYGLHQFYEMKRTRVHVTHLAGFIGARPQTGHAIAKHLERFGLVKLSPAGTRGGKVEWLAGLTPLGHEVIRLSRPVARIFQDMAMDEPERFGQRAGTRRVATPAPDAPRAKPPARRVRRS